MAELNGVIRKYQPEKIVELAPGPARLATQLRGVRKSLMIDYSEEMLRLAKVRLELAGLSSVWKLRRGNAFALESLGCRCGFVYVFRFIRRFHHQDRVRLYRSIRSCLKPGGLFMLDMVNRLLQQQLDAKTPEKAQGGLAVYDVTYTPEEFHLEMATSGFEVVSLKPVLRHFPLQSWISYRFDPRIAKFPDWTVSLAEKIPSGSPLEWIALCRNAR